MAVLVSRDFDPSVNGFVIRTSIVLHNVVHISCHLLVSCLSSIFSTSRMILSQHLFQSPLFNTLFFRLAFSVSLLRSSFTFLSLSLSLCLLIALFVVLYLWRACGCSLRTHIFRKREFFFGSSLHIIAGLIDLSTPPVQQDPSGLGRLHHLPASDRNEF